MAPQNADSESMQVQELPLALPELQKPADAEPHEETGSEGSIDRIPVRLWVMHGAVMFGREFCYAMETALVTPILLQIGKRRPPCMALCCAGSAVEPGVGRSVLGGPGGHILVCSPFSLLTPPLLAARAGEGTAPALPWKQGLGECTWHWSVWSAPGASPCREGAGPRVRLGWEALTGTSLGSCCRRSCPRESRAAASLPWPSAGSFRSPGRPSPGGLASGAPAPSATGAPRALQVLSAGLMFPLS